jgi:hypothetical protein
MHTRGAGEELYLRKRVTEGCNDVCKESRTPLPAACSPCCLLPACCLLPLLPAACLLPAPLAACCLLAAPSSLPILPAFLAVSRLFPRYASPAKRLFTFLTKHPTGCFLPMQGDSGHLPTFSRSSAPPRPFTTSRLGSTSSAPSMATSSLGCSSRVARGMPRPAEAGQAGGAGAVLQGVGERRGRMGLCFWLLKTSKKRG